MGAPNWTGKTWTAKLSNRDIKVTSEQLTRFRDVFVSDADLASRMSQLLWFDICILGEEFGVSPHEILQSIRHVEDGEPAGFGVKPATAFSKEPLKGFWHKHYFAANFLAKNILLQLGKNGLDKLVNEVMNNGEPRITQEMIEELAHRVANDPANQRASANKLTGEWIIFAKHDGKNYYLCLNTHDAGDQFIFDRISEFCTKDFPDLLTWVKTP